MTTCMLQKSGEETRTMGKQQAHTIVRISVALFAAAATILAPQMASAATPVSGMSPSATVNAQPGNADKTGNESNTQSGKNNTPNDATTQSTAKTPAPTTGITPKSATLGSPDSAMKRGASPSVGPQFECPDSGQQPWGNNAYWHLDTSCTFHLGTLNQALGIGTLAATSSYEDLPWHPTYSNVALQVTIDSEVKANENSAFLFLEMIQATKYNNMNLLDTSNVINMNNMFQTNSALTNLDLSSWDMSKVTNTSYMFTADGSLTSIDLSNLDTSVSTISNAYAMFDNGVKMIRLSAAGNLSSLTNVAGDDVNGPFPWSGTPITWSNEDGTWSGPRSSIHPVGRTQWYGRIGYVFDGNGATQGEKPPFMIIPGYNDPALTAPSQNTLEKTGYSFKGWATSPTATTPDYAEGATLPDTTTRNVLYAVWKRAVPKPGINGADAPKSLEGNAVSPSDTVTVSGDLAGATDIDGMSIKLLPAGSTSETEGDGTAAATTTFDTSRNTWSATFPVSAFTNIAADSNGTGVDYVVRAKSLNGVDVSPYTFKTVHVDMIAPAIKDNSLASASGKVTGKAMSAKSGLTGVTPAAEGGDTATITWLDSAGNAITADTPTSVQSSSVAGHIGAFEANWPADPQAVKAKVQVKDATGNTSAISPLELDRPAPSESSAPGQGASNGPGANGANPNGRLSSTGVVIAGITTAAILAAGIALVLSRSKARMRK